MKKGVALLVVLIGVLVLLGVGIFERWTKTYDKMIVANENVNTQWAQVEAQYQRRFDLIPNLVETVKAYASHEETVLTEVTKLRSEATNTTVNLDDVESLASYQETMAGFESALSKLLVVVENYPELKANENFRDLQTQLEGTENRIAVERMKFNEAVGEYNKLIKSFWGRVLAKKYGFEALGFFEVAEGVEEAPVVDFDI